MKAILIFTLKRLPIIVAAVLALAGLVVPSNADDSKVIRVGTLKLIHGISPISMKIRAGGLHGRGLSIRESDRRQECGAHRHGRYLHPRDRRVSARSRRRRAVRIVANANNRGMAVIAGANTDIKSIKDLRGKRVAIWPGSTQEAVILERLRWKACRSRTSSRSGFLYDIPRRSRAAISTPMSARSRPGISLANGTGRLVEYPYSTPIGSLNMILSASEKAVKENPQRVQMIVDMHRKAVDYAMAHPEQIVEVAMQKLGQQKKSIELAVPNVELAWKIDDQFMQRANAYTQLMFENKQIRQMPDLIATSPNSSCSVAPGHGLERRSRSFSGATGVDRQTPAAARPAAIGC